MDAAEFSNRMEVCQATAIFSILFALLGFSCSVWRMQKSEHNSKVRDASFALLLQLAELEQLVFAAHYDSDPVEGNPRVGWFKVGLITGLSITCGDLVLAKAQALRET